MLGEWAKSSVFRAAVVAILILTLLSFFFKRGGNPEHRASIDFDKKIKEAVGTVTAEEAAKALEGKGGDVALILTGTNQQNKNLKNPESDLYEKAFQAAGKQANLRVVGYALAIFPILENGRTYDSPTLKTLQAVRQEFPTANLIVSFANLPVLSDVEQQQWLENKSPKIIAIQHPQVDPAKLEKLMQTGIVYSVILFKQGVRYPEKKPADLREIFQLFYEVKSQATASQ